MFIYSFVVVKNVMCYNNFVKMENVITFVPDKATYEMTTSVNIIKIGNSLGVILPAKVIRKLGVKEKDSLAMDAVEGRVTLTADLSKASPFDTISKGGFYDSDIDPYAFSDMLVKTRGKAKSMEDIL